MYYHDTIATMTPIQVVIYHHDDIVALYLKCSALIHSYISSSFVAISRNLIA